MRKSIAFLILLAFGVVMFNSCGGSKSPKDVVISELTEPCDLAKAMVMYIEEALNLYEELTQVVMNVGDREPTPSEEAKVEAILARVEEVENKVYELEARSNELGITDEELEACPENEKLQELLKNIESNPDFLY